MSSRLSPEIDIIIDAVCRNGTEAAPAGIWDALSKISGVGKHSIRHRSQELRKARGLRVRGPGKTKSVVTTDSAPEPEPKRGWWAPWRKH